MTFLDLQGTVVAFFMCGGQVHNHLCRVSAGFCTPPNYSNRSNFYVSYSKIESVL